MTDASNMRGRFNDADIDRLLAHAPMAPPAPDLAARIVAEAARQPQARVVARDRLTRTGRGRRTVLRSVVALGALAAAAAAAALTATQGDLRKLAALPAAVFRTFSGPAPIKPIVAAPRPKAAVTEGARLAAAPTPPTSLAASRVDEAGGATHDAIAPATPPRPVAPARASASSMERRHPAVRLVRSTTGVADAGRARLNSVSEPEPIRRLEPSPAEPEAVRPTRDASAPPRMRGYEAAPSLSHPVFTGETETRASEPTDRVSEPDRKGKTEAAKEPHPKKRRPLMRFGRPRLAPRP